MTIDPATDDDVTVTAGAVLQDTRGSDHYMPVSVSGATPYEITFDAASANPGDVDVIDNNAPGILRLHGTVRTTLKGDDLLINMMEIDPGRGIAVNHYVYVSEYSLNEDNIELTVWNGTQYTKINAYNNYDYAVIGTNGNDTLEAIRVENEAQLPGVTVHGLNGDDRILSDGAPHRLYGGNGNDTYVLAPVAYDAGTLISDDGGDEDTVETTYHLDIRTTLHNSPGWTDSLLNGLRMTYEMTSGVEYLTSSLDDVKWGWDNYSAGTIGMVSGVKFNTTTPTFYGSDGDDILFAGVGANGLKPVVDGGAGDDVLGGTLYADELRGGAGNDFLTGGYGDDILDGGSGYDRLYGFAGDDILKASTGGDLLDGGDGNDTVDFSDVIGDGLFPNITVNLGANTAYVERWITLASIENVIGSEAGDRITGSAGSNHLEGRGGEDLITGGGGGDVLDGGDGQDTVSYADATAGVAVVLLTGDGVRGQALGDVYISIENVVGSDFDDILIGDDGANKLEGGRGNDVMIGGAGADRMDGGYGVDIVSYSNALSGVTVRLDLQGGSGGDAEGDRYANIENVNGSAFDDVIHGDGWSNVLRGFDGNDKLSGGASNDILMGGAGADELRGDDEGATVQGFDTASYEDAKAGVRTDLLAGRGFTGDAAGDTYFSIEGLTGSAFSDLLNGDNGDNTLNGAAGNDRLAGRGGADRLTGGNGADRFIYSSITDSAVGTTGRDTVTDFSRTQGDRIDLANIDADTSRAGDQAFSFLGTAAFTGHAGEARYISTSLYRVVEVDVDGDGAADMQIRIDGAGALLSSDFIL